MLQVFLRELTESLRENGDHNREQTKFAFNRGQRNFKNLAPDICIGNASGSTSGADGLARFSTLGAVRLFENVASVY